MPNIAQGSSGTVPIAFVESVYSNDVGQNQWGITGPGTTASGAYGSAGAGGWSVSGSSGEFLTGPTVFVPSGATPGVYTLTNVTKTINDLFFPHDDVYAGTFTVVPATDPEPDPDPEPPAAPSAPLTTGPPTGICLGATVPISWAAVATATSYSVYRDGVLLQSGITGLTYTDNTVSVGIAYSFTVTAVSAAGESAPSAALVVTPCSGGGEPDPGGDGGGACCGFTRRPACAGSEYARRLTVVSTFTRRAAHPCDE